MDSFYILVIGRRGTGKTTLIQGEPGITPGLVTYTQRPTYILDTVGNYDRGMIFRSPARLKAVRTKELRTGETLNNTGIYVMRATSDAQVDAYLTLVYAPAATYAQRAGRASDRLSSTLIIDEAPKLCSPHSVHDTLDSVIQYGRNYGIDVILAARRYRQLNVNLRSQADAVISYQQTEARDVAELRKIDEQAAQLSDLGPHEWISLGYDDVIPGLDRL